MPTGDPRVPRVAMLDAPLLPGPNNDTPDAGVSTPGAAADSDDDDTPPSGTGTTTNVPRGR
ncbi:MAG: hypothetical protein Tsb0013_20000 [Phycisphaerales bacterium]